MKQSYRFILFVFILAISPSCLGQGLIRIQKDKILIEKFKAIYENDLNDLSHFFDPPGKNDTTILGLGHYLVSQQKAGGNVSIKAKFLYQNDSLLAIRVQAKMPKDSSLHLAYKNWYASVFSFKDSVDILPLYSNYEIWVAPLSEYTGGLDIGEQSALFRNYISTESGDVFGYWNGWHGLHRNRALFENLLLTIGVEEMELLMFSKNPITRLQAFYYYLTHESEFSPNRKPMIEAWMKKVVNDPKVIKSAEGDLIHLEPAEERLMYYVNIDLENAKNPNPDSCAYFRIGRFNAFFIESNNDSLSYFSGCPLVELDLVVLDRYGTILAEIHEVHNPICIDLTEKIKKEGFEEFKFRSGFYFWKAKYTFETPDGLVTKEAQCSLRIYR